MHFSALSPIFLVFSLALAHNKTRLGIAQPTVFSLSPSLRSNSSSAEVVATIQIQIGDLSGSGVINLSNIAITSESGALRNTHLTETFITNNGAYQTESVSASCTLFSLPETTSTLNYNATSGISRTSGASGTSRTSGASGSSGISGSSGTSATGPLLTPTVIPDSTIFSSSGNHGLPEMTALLSAVAVQIGVVFLL